MVEHVGLREQDVAVIPNGVDTRRFAPTQRAHTTNELLVGTVGSLTPVKNQALLIRACARVIQQGLALRLDIVGEGRERPALEGLVRSLGMTGRVRLLGHIDDIPAFLNGLDLFVLPSDSEAHPNALSEAMACGLACIASRVGGVAEIADQRPRRAAVRAWRRKCADWNQSPIWSPIQKDGGRSAGQQLK
ncbi:MAG: glycosyltransferase [Betaproteobacteria bacterium]|nr:glycosyltransferase [Betaproteobacteria bacterium]